MTRHCVLLCGWVMVIAAAALPAGDEPSRPPAVTAEPSAGGSAPAGAESAGKTAGDPASSPFEHRPIGKQDSGSLTGQVKSGSLGGGYLASTLLATAGVVGLILAGAWAVKRWAPGPLGGRGSGPFRVLARWPLSAKQHVAMVQLGRRLLVVGVTAQQVSLLADICEPGEVAQLLAACPSGRSILSEGFGQLLGRQQAEMADHLSEGDRAGGSAAGPGPAFEQLRDQVQSRLEQVRTGGQT